MITHRERMQALLRRESLDRTPVALWRHFPVDDQAPETQAAAHVAFQEQYDFDLVKVTPSSSFTVRDWGVEDAWQGESEGTRTYLHHVISEPQDWERLRPLEPRAGTLGDQLACIGLIRKALGPDTPILQTVFSPLSQAKYLAGGQLLLTHLRQHPAALEVGLAIIAQTTRRFVDALTSAGVDGIFYAVQHAQAGILSREEFLRFGRSWDLKILEPFPGFWCNILHLHGEDLYFDAVTDYPLQIINWHDRETPPSLAEAPQQWHGALCGGISRETLVYGGPADVRQEARDAMEQTHKAPLVLSTGCVTPIIAPHGNILAVRRSVESS